MRVVLTGATGMIGGALVDALLARGDAVGALVRDEGRALSRLGDRVELHEWPEPESDAPPSPALAGADAVVNLMGEPIAQRWTDDAKHRIRDSRVLGTRSLVDALRDLPGDQRPATLISQSATGFYGPAGEEQLDETAPAGDGFLAEVTREWESEALRASPPMRVVCTRTGVVLARDGGALAQMLPFFRLGLGGPVAGGRQYVPWVHLDDVVAGILHCIDHPQLDRVANLSSPTPVRDAEFSRALGRVLHRPARLPVPGLILRVLYGEMAQVVTNGQRAIPAALQRSGYQFRHADVEEALRAALS